MSDANEQTLDPSPHYRADIDGLRALAVVSVMVFHYFPRLAPGGFVGVDVFFVISGFLISSVLIDDLVCGRPLFSRFYTRRVRRIFPALFVVLLAVWLGGYVFLLPGAYTRLGKHTAGAAGFVANFLYWNESGYFDESALTKPLLHLWSLGVEEQFYLVWPVLLFVVWRTRFRNAALALLFVASLTAGIFTGRHDATAAFFSPLDRFWELLAGAGLAFASRDPPSVAWWRARPLLRNVCAVAGVGLIGIAIGALNGAQFAGSTALTPVAGAVFFIAGGNRAWINREVFSRRPAVWLGLVSYPLYLWHWPLFSFVRIVHGYPSVAWRLMIAAASLALATATYGLIERPIRTRAATRGMALGLCAAMALPMALGIAVLVTKGRPSRYPPELRQIGDFSFDWSSTFRVRQCMLFPDDDTDKRVFASECLDSRPAMREHPEILLWGDSHAAQLYSGFAAVYGDTFRISQLTVATCAPLFGVALSAPNCAEFNDPALDAIRQRKPAIVVLGARWVDNPWRALPETVTRLRAAGVRTIVVVGEVPLWNDPLPDILARLALKDRPRFRIPARTTEGLDRRVFDVDREVGQLSVSLGVIYESPMAILCDRDGCLTRAADTIDSVMAFDAWSHLTTAGSRYLVERFHRIR